MHTHFVATVYSGVVAMAAILGKVVAGKLDSHCASLILSILCGV